MKPVTIDEVRSLEGYERDRENVRKRMLAVKEPRRVRAGENLTFLFENRDTMLYQIQEMLRVERITEPAAIAHEVATYNELVPGPDELTATLLIEFEDASERAIMLKALVGLEKHIRLAIEGQAPCLPVFDDRQMLPDKISSVHYIRFPLGKARADALRTGKAVAIVVDHPRLSTRVALSERQRAALAEDLSAA
jgi:hypothetical protein